MVRRFRAARLLALALTCGCAAWPSDPANEPEGVSTALPSLGAGQIEALGRQLTTHFLTGDADALSERLDETMLSVLGDVPAFLKSVNETLGGELEVLEERTIPWLGGGVYIRRARYSRQVLPFDLMWTMDAAGRVIGLFYRPAPLEAPGPNESRHTASRLRLPFEGRWYVYWGGRSLAENHHVGARDQRYAYDFVVVAENSTHRGDGSDNQHYYAFGRPIVAPAGGTVVSVENRVPDNRPGVMNPIQPLGNHVVIDHGNGEYSFMAHFQRGTVLVRAGEVVLRGQVLARCGNSGNSSEPHLHYHLQDKARFGQGDGLPAQFLGYLLDGHPVWRGEPTRGRAVEHVDDIVNIHEPKEEP